MAFSQPLTESVRRKGQTALQCQLCENNPKIKWKCLECKLMMCQKCRDKVHSKFASAEDHTIIDIKEISKHQADSEPKPDLTRIKCGIHSGQNCCFYCKTCQELVCQTCIIKTHNKHEFRDISDEYTIKMEKVRSRHKNIEKEMQTLIIGERKLKQMKLNEQSNYVKVKQEILDHDKALISEIKKQTDKLLKNLDQKWEAVSKTLDNEMEKLKETQSKIQKQIQQINTLLQPSNVKDVFSGSNSMLISRKTNIPPTNTLFQGIPKFTHGDQTKIPLILGKLEDVSIQYNTDLRVDKMFDTGLESITSVVSCPDGFLWLCEYVSEIVQKVKLKGDKISVISNINIEVLDAAILPPGDLLLSVAGSFNIKLVPSGSTDIQDSVYTVSPLQPTGVHVTGDNKVIVGAIDTGNIPATGPRQVIVMDQTGHHEKVFQYDRHNKPIFIYPFPVTSNSQGNIAVVDFITGDFTGRVVVLDQEGEVRNIYTGHPHVNNEDNPFRPTGITTTPSDNFVVADLMNHTLHILNSEGELITFYNTEEIGIILPRSLSFSSTGQLYIGCGTYEDSKEKVKLYKVNNFFY